MQISFFQILVRLLLVHFTLSLMSFEEENVDEEMVAPQDGAAVSEKMERERKNRRTTKPSPRKRSKASELI